MENKIEDIIDSMLRESRQDELVSCQRLSGVNSLIYRVLTRQGKEYLVKKYIQRPYDNNDRLSTEFSGLQFIWDNGIHNVPEPICSDAKNRIAIYGFIRGRKLQREEVTEREIKMALDFLQSMHGLVSKEGAERQPIAKEACFNLNGYIDCIDRRLNCLKSIFAYGEIFKKLNSFLDKEFSPFKDGLLKFIEKQAKSSGLDFSTEIKKEERTLSPSDFGFHNAIKTDDGKMYFFDFEYYGWDDPAKTIGDFYLQPQVPVPLSYRKLFYLEISGFMGNNSNLVKRVPIVYLLLALKWCLIMLNVFLYYSDGSLKDEQLCLLYLERARNKLKDIKRELKAKVFPLSLN